MSRLVCWWVKEVNPHPSRPRVHASYVQAGVEAEDGAGRRHRNAVALPLGATHAQVIQGQLLLHTWLAENGLAEAAQAWWFDYLREDLEALRQTLSASTLYDWVRRPRYQEVGR